MARCTLVLLTGMVALYMSAASPAWELPGVQPQDFVDEEAFLDVSVHMHAEELADGFSVKLKRCVRKVDSSKLQDDEKKVLRACIRPALRGQPKTPEAIAERYAECVASKSPSEAAKEAAKQVANCMTSAAAPVWELPRADPQDLMDEQAFLDDLMDMDAEKLTLNGFAAKLRECVRRVDKTRLNEEERRVLQACISPALCGRPYDPQAIAERYTKCVRSKYASANAMDATRQVANCMCARS